MIPVGYARRAHGIGGEVVVRPQSDDPQRWIAGATVTTDESPGRTLEVASVRNHHDDLLVAFAGIGDRDAAEALQGVTFLVPETDRRALGDGEYWPDDLVGCAVVETSGRELGVVTGVDFGPGQDRLLVKTATGEVAVPFVAEIVPAIDIDGGVITIDPPDGLF